MNSSDEQDSDQDEEDVEQPSEPMHRLESAPAASIHIEESKYISSNFSFDDDNTIYGHDYVIFGLKPNQNLIVKGQFVLEIQRGAIDINGVIYHSGVEPMNFINPSSSSIPLIQATQVLNSSLLENKETQENQHLFTPGYKSVIKLTNLDTHLESIGRVCPLFKNLFWQFDNFFAEDSLRLLDQYELAFSDYTFYPITKPDNTVSVIKHKNWMDVIKSLTELYSNDQSIKVIVIGGKNSGKSTFLRLLVQHMLSPTLQQLPINFMDLDPGQPEYSGTDCISLSKISEVQHGNHLSLTSTDSTQCHYVGFNSPKDQPTRYNLLVEQLVRSYESDGELKHESLLINTPGWIKGYGLELTRTLIERVKPTHVIYLNSGTLEVDIDIPKGTNLIPLQGSFNHSGSRYSSSQLRLLKTMAYFHKIDDFKFDFQPLLFSPPIQVSYGVSTGISALTHLKETGIGMDHLERSIEATIVGIFKVKRDHLEECELFNKGQLPLLPYKEFIKLNTEFFRLALVHSIDQEKKIMNLYIPQFRTLDLTKEAIIMVRGNTDLPIWEIASNEIVKRFKRQLPYITFEKGSSLDKKWKVRKNVQRRGQM